jgi:hypothetical protein
LRTKVFGVAVGYRTKRNRLMRVDIRHFRNFAMNEDAKPPVSRRAEAGTAVAGVSASFAPSIAKETYQ